MAPNGFRSAEVLEYTPAFSLARWALVIDGIEISQAVQYFQADEHLTDSADRNVDNAVRLVANKPAWVRVYVWSLFGSSPVIATLEVRRRSSGFIFGAPVAVLAPDPSSMTATSLPGSSYAATRGSLSESLNFIVPASEMIGTLRFTAKVSSGSRTAEQSVDVGVTLRQRLRLAGVMIAYNGPASSAPSAPNLTIAAPTLPDLQAMAGDALTLFPVESTASFRNAGNLTLTSHLQDTSFPTTGCGAGWDALHARVVNARTADGNQPGWIYYGLLPTGVPMGPVGGCGGGGVAVGPVNQPGTLAHEAGHACGLDHAPAGGAPNPDPLYPAYEPYDPASTPQASTGEYGLNVNNGNIASPQTFRDFMSYASPPWIGLYHYGRLLNNARLNPTTVGVDYPWWKDLVWEERLRWPPIPPGDPPPFDLELPVNPPSYWHDVISLIVRVDDGKVAEVLHVARTRAHTGLPGGSATSFRARLRDVEGSVIATGDLVRLRTAACGCGDSHDHADSTSYLAQAFLPDVGAGAALEIAGGDEVMWRREAPEKPPKVEATAARVNEEGTVNLSWDASDGVAEYWVRWSRDGEDWQAVATGVQEREIRVDPGQIPPGEGLLQVVAHDGFFSGYSKPVSVSVPERAADLVILHPVDGHTYVANQTLRLWASVADAKEEPDLDARWLLDGKEVARGLDAWATLSEGDHTLTVGVAGSRKGRARVRISATSPKAPDETRPNP